MSSSASAAPSILKFFKKKSDLPDAATDLGRRIPCPACSLLVEKAVINSHLDNDCGSKSISGCVSVC